MEEKEQDYAKASFEDVATKYDEIPFFKISAKYVVEIIQKYTQEKNLQVLDVACGTGNVVLSCASCMPEANFDAMDISENMLAKAEQNAKNDKLENVTFHLQDITKLDTEKKYDVITCAYALFFLPNAHKVLKTLVSLLNDKGFVIFTSFTAQAFTPSNEILLKLMREHGSATAHEYEMDRWENLKEVKDIERLCRLSETDNCDIESKKIRYDMSLDEWWELLNNTGYKGMLMELSEEAYENVKQGYYSEMFKHANMDGEVELIADTNFVVVS